MRRPELPEDRYNSKVDRSAGLDDCWPWTGTQFTEGYGRFWFEGKFVRASRWGYVHLVGPIPNGDDGRPLQVLHRCDNPPCHNPSHWFLGTIAENMADRQSKGRQAKADGHYSRTQPDKLARGQHNGSAKLTPAQVVAIRDRYQQGIRQKQLSAEFSTCQSNISLILRHEAWAHI